MNVPSYSNVVRGLHRTSIPVRQIESGSGNVAVTSAAGRIIAMAFSPDDSNLLWSHPKLQDDESTRRDLENLAGGMGGDRLWFGPELLYHWDGKPDWKTQANYKVPRATDPGEYRFVEQSSDAISLSARGALPVLGSDQCVHFEVSRKIQLTPPPLPSNHSLMAGVKYVGVEVSHALLIEEQTRIGLIGLWRLLQVSPGSVLIVPVKNAETPTLRKPLSYGLQGSWIEHADHILWRYEGNARAKFGLSAAVLTGRSAAIRKLGPDSWSMIVREFSVHSCEAYGDHPYGIPRKDQAFQAWDGLGFGELEFHSPILNAESGPRELRELDRLWAFGGTAHAIAALGIRLLGVDVSYVFEE